MAAVASARSIFLRSNAVQTAATRVASRRPSLRRSPVARNTSAATRVLRSPRELSCGVETLFPMHSATAAALMTSMLSVSLRGYGSLSEAANEDG